MRHSFYENVMAFQEKKHKTLDDYINYIKAMTYIEIFEYNSNCSYAALDLDKSDIRIIADYFTKLGFECNYRSDYSYLNNSNTFYRFYLHWQKEGE